MGKPHKFAWNGVDVETTLSVEQLANMAQRAAQECTGDLMHGKHRIVPVRSTDRQIEFRINDYLISFKKYMVFHLDFQVRDGRTWMSSRIDWYVTTQPTVGGFIPVATKTMVGHNTYLQFVRNLAGQVQRSDTGARVTIREGVAVTPPASSPPPPAPVRPPAGTPPQPGAAPVPSAAIIEPLRPVPGAEPPPPIFSGGLRPPPAPFEGGARISPPPPPPAHSPDPTGVRRVGLPEPSGLVTSVPGMPKREPAPQERPTDFVPGGYASVAEQLFAEDESLFHTRLAQQGLTALPWVLRPRGGAERSLEQAVVLGRDPAQPPGASGASPIAVDDPNRSVSKTHALIELREGLPWVTDLHSTNGTTLTNEVGEALMCEPGVPVPIGDGWTVGLGEYPITVVRRPGS